MKKNQNFQPAITIGLSLGLIILALSGGLGSISIFITSGMVDAQEFVYSRFVVLKEFFTIPRDVVTLRQRNAQLESELARLQADVVTLQKSVEEGEILAALVKYSRTNPENTFQAANVIGRDPSPFLRYLIIDKGSSHGILKGMPVVTEQGLVGRVDAVISDAARVQLITDSASVVNIRLDKAQRDAVLRGSPNGDLLIELLSQDIIVEPGEVVLTSGISGGYPSDLIIGQIINVKKKDSDLFQEATVQPVVDFRNLKLVMVIRNFKSIDITPLTTGQ